MLNTKCDNRPFTNVYTHLYGGQSLEEFIYNQNKKIHVYIAKLALLLKQLYSLLRGLNFSSGFQRQK